MLRGVDTAIEALRDIQRIQALSGTKESAATRLERLINRLRTKGAQFNQPLLITLADALDDALIQATEDYDN